MRQTHNKGLIGILVIIVLAIITLSYFNVDLEKVANEPDVQKNIEYISNQTTTFWKTNLEKPFHEFWTTIVVKELWNAVIKNAAPVLDQPLPDQLEQPLTEIH